MVYAYDEILPMPTKDLYDTLLMAMAISAAKDQYDKAEKRLEDLENNIGDFYSPLENDVNWYKKNVEDRIKNELADMYSKSDDPLRSVEGRVRLRKLSRSVPKAIINQMKANAENYQKRKDAIMEAKAKGQYDEAFDNYMREAYRLPSAENFSTVGTNGRLNSFDPSTFRSVSMNDFITPFVKDIKEGELTKADMEKYYPEYEYDPRRRYVARTEGMLRNAISGAMPSLKGNPIYEYNRNIAEQQLKAKHAGELGYTPTEEEIDQQFENNAFGAISRFVTNPTSELDDFAKLQYQYSHSRSGGGSGGYRTGGNGSGNRRPSSGVYSYLSYALNAATQSGQPITSRQIGAYNNVMKSAKNGVLNPQDVADQLTVEDGSDAIFGHYINRTVDYDGSVAYIPAQDERKFFTAAELLNNAQNIYTSDKNKQVNKAKSDSIRKQLRNSYDLSKETSTDGKPKAEAPTIVPTGKSLFYTDTNGVVRHYIEAEAEYSEKSKSGVLKKRIKLYMDSGAQYDLEYKPTGNWAAALAADQRASGTIATRPNKTNILIDPTDYDLKE